MEYVITTIDKQSITISQQEYEKIAKAISSNKQSMFMLKSGNMINSHSISSIISYEEWATQYRMKLRESGKRLCKYGNIHWLNEECTCRPNPGEATKEELDISKGLLLKAQKLLGERKKEIKQIEQKKKEVVVIEEDSNGNYYIDENGDKIYS